MGVNIDHLRSWIGKTATATEMLHASQLAGLAATLEATLAAGVMTFAVYGTPRVRPDV